MYCGKESAADNWVIFIRAFFRLELYIRTNKEPIFPFVRISLRSRQNGASAVIAVFSKRKAQREKALNQ
jgi:hypothetical protein